MKRILLLICITPVLLLGGCIDFKEIQLQSYAVSFAVDYKDDQYELFLQFLDFGNVAKTEDAENKAPVWIVKGTGTTIEAALDQIYSSVQVPINYDHINTILLSKSVLEQQSERILTFLTTRHTLPYTSYVYVIEKPAEEIMTTDNIFDYPMLYSQMSQPEDMQELYSTIPAIRLHEVMRNIGEPNTVVIPTIALDTSTLHEDRNPVTSAFFSGGAFLQDHAYLGWLSRTDLKGYILANNETIRYLIEFVEDDQNILVEVTEPSVSLKDEDGKTLLNVKYKLGILEMGMKSKSPVEIQNRIKEIIEQEIKKADDKASALGADLFGVKDHYFRKGTLKKESDHSLSIDQINIHFSEVNSMNKTQLELDRKSNRLFLR
ncbi:Ger(x)C family spore germination C-terminal domain-containing protein [Alteribacter aurantiacus]|uniref:Ger(x)C family spore germination protein n=1 Tax=Alteribacter aurantiacus TaxID=254410 RepID=UPI00040E6950|nr:Ger(x)C family spore germination C-terminal domain-containing protein [Alteribacter aurantiacus]